MKTDQTTAPASPRAFTNPAQRIVVALDLSDGVELREMVRALRGRVGLFKIGKELFTALGPKAVEVVQAEGGEVFLDLKFHDIPNTVAGAVRSAARLEVFMLTVHATGGAAMLTAAVDAARQATSDESLRSKIISVTVLTSLDAAALQQIGLAGSPQEAALRLGRMAVQSGVDGLVCSPMEVAALRAALGPGPLLVVPGVRSRGEALGDQKRVASPQEAVQSGADYLVIGRPITQANDPAKAAEKIAAEIT